ncbi:MAG: glycosyltransferase [Ardenticatenaceae bacterium]|nr:glycosyltransferase [Ardenticatenaceae bacterium]
MTYIEIIALFVSAALFIMGITAVSNFLLFPRLKPTQPTATPFVSLLIPARNEAAVIARTVTALLAQNYPHFELLLLDDGSEDETAVFAQQAAQQNPRFRIIQGKPLPAGWLGKNWACHQLSQAAQGDLLIFTDADVQWQPDALSALVSYQFTAHRSPSTDLLTIWPTQLTHTWAERLTVPNIALAILAYLPILPVHFTNWSAFAAANGQCMAFRREAYDAIGGHAAVRDNIVEDVALARRIKQAGRRLRMADGNRLITCRMYDSWAAVRNGFAKNILAGHGNNVPFLLASTLFHWLVFLFPWIWLAVTGSVWAWVLVLVSVGVRLGTAVFTHQRPLDAILMPISVLLITRIAAQSIWWHYHGGPQWKGRTANGNQQTAYQISDN